MNKQLLFFIFISFSAMQGMRRSPTSLANLHRAAQESSTAQQSTAVTELNPEYAIIITANDVNAYPLLGLLAKGVNLATWDMINNSINNTLVDLTELLALRHALITIPWTSLNQKNLDTLLASIENAVQLNHADKKRFNIVILWPKVDYDGHEDGTQYSLDPTDQPTKAPTHPLKPTMPGAATRAALPYF